MCTPSAFKYRTKSAESGRMIVDLMLFAEYFGYHEENWNDRMYEEERVGRTVAMMGGAGRVQNLKKFFLTITCLFIDERTNLVSAVCTATVPCTIFPIKT